MDLLYSKYYFLSIIRYVRILQKIVINVVDVRIVGIKSTILRKYRSLEIQHTGNRGNYVMDSILCR